MSQIVFVERLLPPAPPAGLQFTPEEQSIMEHIAAAREEIKALGLRANKAELASGVHTLQMFVIAHALQRIGFRGLTSWYWATGDVSSDPTRR